MKTIVWYGAGNNLRKFEADFVAETGYPAYICDRDKDKQGTIYQFSNKEGYECHIVSLDDAINNCENYEIWITLASHNVREVFCYLTDECGISAERIYFFGDREYRLGCDFLDGWTYFEKKHVRMCCNSTYATLFNFEDESDITNSIEKMEKWRHQTIQALKEGKKTSCDGCPELKWKDYPKVTKVTNFVALRGESFCNCRCFYCNQYDGLKQHDDFKIGYYDSHILAANYYPNLQHITFVLGEPTLLPDFGKVMELSKERKWYVTMISNGIIYSDLAAKTIGNDSRSKILVSLDSGTRVAYERIKRVNKFDQVVGNLKKYAAAGCKISLKYIMIPGYNDTREEIEAFIDIAKDLGAMECILSQNISDYYDGKKNDDSMPDMSERMFSLCEYMISRLKDEKIPCGFDSTFFSLNDLRRLRQE